MRKKETLSLLLLFLTIIIYIYRPLIYNGFTAADDRWSLLHNPLVVADFTSLSYYWKLMISFNSNQYSPLNTFYYALIYKINKFDPYYYHLASLVIHCINSLLLISISKKLLNHFNFHNQSNSYLPYLIAFLWAIHPLNVEAVSWISASKVLLSSLFTLLSINSFLAYFSHQRKLELLASFFYFLLGFLCKEQVLVLPIIFLAIRLLPRFYKVHFSPIKPQEIIFYTAAIALSIVIVWFTLKANHITGIPSALSKYSSYQRFFLGFYCIFFYISNFILPLKLHYHYPFPIKPTEALPLSFYAFFILCILITAIFSKLITQKSNLFFLVCLIIAIVEISLCLQFVPLNRPAIVADRYMYLSSAFLILGCAQFIPLINKKSKFIYIGLLVVYTVFFSVYSNKLVQNWNKITIKTQ
jgi:hypothetical protein